MDFTSSAKNESQSAALGEDHLDAQEVLRRARESKRAARGRSSRDD